MNPKVGYQVLSEKVQKELRTAGEIKNNKQIIEGEKKIKLKQR